MIDISGRYEFHRDGFSPGMQIVRVDHTGQILEGQVGDAPIRGQYHTDTNAIDFNDARQPGGTLFVTFYTGYVMLNSQGGVYGMAGSYQELTISRGGSIATRTAEAPAGPAAPGAKAAATAAVETAPNFGVSTLHGAWFAIRLDEPLV